MCGRRKIGEKLYERPAVGDLVYILDGIRHKTGLVINVSGSIWHKHIEDWEYTILVDDGTVKKMRGWRVERIRAIKRENKD